MEKIYRVVKDAEGRDYEVLSYHKTIELAEEALKEVVKARMEAGFDWVNYTKVTVEELDFGGKDSAKDDWYEVLNAADMWDVFPRAC